jgi:esterase/lipase superfamily enzyme
MPTDTVRHFFVTNRNVYQHGPREYIREDGEEGAGHDLRFGEIYFDPEKPINSVTGEHYRVYPDADMEMGPAEADSNLDPRSQGFTYQFTREHKFGSTHLFEEIHQCSVGENEETHHTLFYIHGFNNDLATAFETVRQLHNLYVVNPDSPIKQIVLFTWPSMSRLLEYRDDAQDAIISGYALARGLKKLQRYFTQLAWHVKQGGKEELCRQKIHLMCHSMGNRVLQAMFEEINQSRTMVNSIFGEIILLAADIDYDALESPNPLYNLIEIGERVHVYFHKHDKALGISELTKNSFNRLGRWGAKNSSNLPDDIWQSNVSAVPETRASLSENVINHWYYLTSDEVNVDIIRVLIGGNSQYLV